MTIRIVCGGSADMTCDDSQRHACVPYALDSARLDKYLFAEGLVESRPMNTALMHLERIVAARSRNISTQVSPSYKVCT